MNNSRRHPWFDFKPSTKLVQQLKSIGFSYSNPDYVADRFCDTIFLLASGYRSGMNGRKEAGTVDVTWVITEKGTCTRVFREKYLAGVPKGRSDAAATMQTFAKELQAWLKSRGGRIAAPAECGPMSISLSRGSVSVHMKLTAPVVLPSDLPAVASARWLK